MTMNSRAFLFLFSFLFSSLSFSLDKQKRLVPQNNKQKIKPGVPLKKVAMISLDESIQMLIGYGSDKANLTLTQSSKISLSGQGLRLFSEYQRKVSNRTLLGLGLSFEDINTEGSDSSILACADKCIYKVSYLGVNLSWTYFNDLNADFKFLAGVTGSLVFPLQKESNIIDTNSVSLAGKIGFESGFRWKISRADYIPFLLSWTYLPNPNFININQIFIKVGYGYSF
jgi:hypothetical protein